MTKNSYGIIIFRILYGISFFESSIANNLENEVKHSKVGFCYILKTKLSLNETKLDMQVRSSSVVKGTKWKTYIDEEFMLKGCEDRNYVGISDVPFYQVFHQQLASWHDAYEICRNLHGGWELATVKCEKEEKALERSLLAWPQSKRFWINANDFRWQGVYDWGNPQYPSKFSDGPIIYSRWSKGQPDNFQGVEHCVEVISDRNFEWNDYNCNGKLNFVCQLIRN